MVASIAPTVTSPNNLFTPVTVAGAGLTASTDYIVECRRPSGNISKHEVTTDGAGAFSFDMQMQNRGLHSLAVRPKTEYFGTTTPLATASVTISGT